ncbi:tetratricopeptide repeat protein [Bacteroides propionicifaciens]|uniref:tetratricopeptide repeat protein n=1 Tax=Bacteroides propionicifaciens TaxID=392838 RepID=UPI000AF22BF9|nr:tetratricopeptide repeat protein [Bacteroides propionicifaciens]
MRKIYLHFLSLSATLYLLMMTSVAYAQISSLKLDSILLQSKNILQANPQEALRKSKMIMDYRDSLLNTEILTEALFIYGRAASYLGDFDTAMLSLFDAMLICPSTSQGLKADIYMEISDIYNRLKDYRQAFEYNDKALAIFKSQQDSIGIASSFNNRGIVHANLLEFDVAEQFFKNALAINRRLGNIKSVAANLNNLCLYEGNSKEKLGFIEESIVINKNLNANWALCENYNNKGKQLFYAGKYDDALATLLCAQKEIAQVGSKELECDNYEYLSWVYSAMGQYDKAYNSLYKLFLLSHELSNGQKLRSLDKSIADKKLQDAQRQVEFKENAMKIENLKRNVVFLFTIIVLLFVVSLFIYRWSKKRKDLELVRAKLDLEKSQRELAELKILKQNKDLESIQEDLNQVNKEATTFAMFIKSRNELLESIQDQIKHGAKLPDAELKRHLRQLSLFLIQYQGGNQVDSLLLKSIEEKNQSYIIRLEEKHPGLTRGEINLALLLRVNLSTKDIALLLGSNPKSVNMNRYRLRKSLHLDSEDNLVEYLQHV